MKFEVFAMGYVAFLVPLAIGGAFGSSWGVLPLALFFTAAQLFAIWRTPQRNARIAELEERL